MDTDHAKDELRTRVRKALAEMTPAARHDASLLVCRRLETLESVVNAGTVMLYMPLATEVDVTPLALALFRAGRAVCVPRVDWEKRDMQAIEVTTFDDRAMQTDVRDLRSPIAGRLVTPEQIDVVIVPALAFDDAGHRLGRGGGYYDRFLPRTRSGCVRVGVAFERQVVDAIPVEPHDARVDAVVTERRTTRSAPARPRRR